MNATADTAMKVRCKLGWIPNGEYAGFWLAETAGAYGTAGVEVEFLPGGPGRPGAIEELLGGTAEIAVTSDLPSLLHARAGGSDLRVLGAVLPHSPLGLATTVASGIRLPQDLAGRVIGAGTAHDHTLLTSLMAVHGISDPFELRTVDAGFKALAEGDVEVLSCSIVNQVPAARDAGLQVLAWTFAELGLPMPGDLIVCDWAWAQENPGEVTAFLEGSRDGWSRQLADPELGARITWEQNGSDWGFSLDECLRECNLLATFMREARAPLEIDEASFARTARLVARSMDVDDDGVPAALADLAHLRGTSP